MNSNLNLPIRRAGFVGATTIAALGGVLLSGCGRRPIIVQSPPATVVQQPAPVPVATPVFQTPAPIVVVGQLPRAPLQETQAPQPTPQHVWIPGYWAWRGNQQQWVTGHWEIPPRTGATWVPARWDPRGSDYIFVDGYWQ